MGRRARFVRVRPRGTAGTGSRPVGRALRARSTCTAGVSLRSRPCCGRLGRGPGGRAFGARHALDGRFASLTPLSRPLGARPWWRASRGRARCGRSGCGCAGTGRRLWRYVCKFWSCICRILGDYPGEGAGGCAQRWLWGQMGPERGLGVALCMDFGGYGQRAYARGVPRRPRGPRSRGARGSRAQKKTAWGAVRGVHGGDKGVRTPDLVTASHALSQLSYAPVRWCARDYSRTRLGMGARILRGAARPGPRP